MGTGSSPGGKERSGRDADSSPPSSAVGHERVELYLYSPYGPYGLYRASVSVQGRTLPCFTSVPVFINRSQWLRGLRHRSTAARLLRSWVRIPPWAKIFVCCDCSVLSGGGLCDELITRPEKSHRLCCVVVCDLET